MSLLHRVQTVDSNVLSQRCTCGAKDGINIPVWCRLCSCAQWCSRLLFSPLCRCGKTQRLRSRACKVRSVRAGSRVLGATTARSNAQEEERD
jgi:hypothetical protein